MSNSYGPLVLALQQSTQLFYALLVHLDLRSAPQYLWTGVGDFQDVNGQIWRGVGVLGSVSDVDRALVSSATPTLTLSGLEPGVAAAAIDSSDEVKGRGASVFEQYFNGDQTPLGPPLSLWSGIMDRVVANMSVDKSTVSVSTASLLYRRRRPSLAYLSAATQQKLHPGDTGLSEISRLVQAQENWPNY